MKTKFQLVLKSAAGIPGDWLHTMRKFPPAVTVARNRSEQVARDLIARSQAPFCSLAPQPQIGVRY